MNQIASTPANNKQANQPTSPISPDNKREVQKLKLAPRESEAFNGTTGMTGKLSPINETSREYKSSSSGSSGAHTTYGAATTFQHSKRGNRLLSAPADINPFDGQLITQFLDQLVEPLDKRRGFFFVNRNLPKLKPQITSLKLGTDKYLIHDQRDEGAYAKIYAAQLVDEGSDDTMAMSKVGTSKWFALKVSTPPNAWEFYICDELHKRLTSKCSQRPIDIELSIMCVNPAVLFKDATVLVDELCTNGSIIRVMNMLKLRNKVFPKTLLAYFALELLLVVKEMHVHQIVHADLKPDNILVVNFPSKEDINGVTQRTSCIKLIDFGRAIDMHLFPEKTAFNYKVETKGSQCPEMLDSRPWNYHTDWFGVLDIIHTLLFGEYIVLSEGGKSWGMKSKLNKRLHAKELWEPLFDNLLNIDQNDASCPPIVDQTIAQLSLFVANNKLTILKEADELETLMEQENVKVRK